ncbi:hypothetical protein CONLIGDRAFT_711873 [Coniochaeta ligniaria NRRL 30616]|uniref:Rhodopsin domain-containing protein n=1 Tax=Coniochaeta ligniaria NRRL 30616 TaxID=1408157 RepID=A0A1J7K1R2_9PEZI|nr:hypothetical protein CONLIGDRAFT_711873 [Coniochaeta ligniaria NRRL 30616]
MDSLNCYEVNGVEACIEGPDDVGPYLLRVIWVLAALSGLFLGLRLYSKLWRRRPLWWDDYFLVAAWLSLVVSITLQTVGVSHGLGKHYIAMTEEQKSAVTIYSISAGFGSILATAWSKIAFAMSLLRISTGRVRTVVWIIIVSTSAVFVANGMIQWFQCWPVSKAWDWNLEGSCWTSLIVQDINTFVAAFSGAMDITLAILPWKIVWTVAINKKEKIGALLAMSMGVFAGVMAILKIRTLYTIGNDNTTTVDLFIFGTAEPATAIMAASIPVLRALIRRGSDECKQARFIQLDDEKLGASPTVEEDKYAAAPYPGTLPLGHLDEDETWEPKIRGVEKLQ